MSKDATLAYLDSIAEMLQCMRKDYVRRTTPTRRLMCGEWIRCDGKIKAQVYEKSGMFFLQLQTDGGLSPQFMQCTQELHEDRSGKVYIRERERNMVYDSLRDTLVVESLGEFIRKKDKKDEK